ncbi:MAG: hypothetical protein J7M20_02905 [Deltaproteobacteria bacterium]|nr:hypothetical protein [Deltaproteobacteria bacterium]
MDQVKGFAGFGTVVSGTILSGTLKRDDTLCLLPSGIETRARSLETHHEKGSESSAGQRVGINLHKISLKQVRRGMVLTEPGTVNPSYLLNVHLQVLQSAKKPIKNRQRVKLYLGTSVTNTLAVIMEMVLSTPVIWPVVQVLPLTKSTLRSNRESRAENF